ncbi:Lsr2 family protein [Knoellia sp. S7-12]|uniref:histone-like nucleoid-structuring protein Lsr2 n=1 Tax=Knoellia sp. S7-12 TaxID=3126698 RepID=UPI00336922B7
MAKNTTVTITDDLDGSANAKEVSFSLDGRTWLIDLSAKNRAAMEKALKPYIAKAIEQGRQGRRGKAARTPSRAKSRTDLGAVREWAKTNGRHVSERGRISADVLNAYDAAQ